MSERERVKKALESIGWWIPETRANFVWLELGDNTPRFAQLAEENALSVRAFGNEGVRVSIGEDEANTRFISLCQQCDYAPKRPE